MRWSRVWIEPAPITIGQDAVRHLDAIVGWRVRTLARLGEKAPGTVDITGTFDRKVAAVRAHASQIKDPASLAGRLRQRIAHNTAADGLAEGRNPARRYRTHPPRRAAAVGRPARVREVTFLGLAEGDMRDADRKLGRASSVR